MALFDKGYALVVGIANYPKVQRLSAPVLKDATDISALLMDATQCGYPPGQVRHLLDEQATADNIRTELRWLAERTGEEDTAVFFFSGHGGRIESGSQAGNYLIPYDTDPAQLQKTAIAGKELTGLLSKIKAGRLLVLFDCCHAGGTGETKSALDESTSKFKSGLDEGYYEHLARGQGRVIIASSRSTEVSWVLPGMGNSLFTHFLLEGLRGQARTYGEGWVGVLDVFNFVAEEVPKRQPQQHPILKAELETNFPIALHRGGQQSQSDPAIKPSVENPRNLSLPGEAMAVLKSMFAGYGRVVVEKEFGGGFGGGRVFLVRPIRRNDLPELPAVVKMASVSLIQKEWGAYQDCIRDRLPHSAGVRDKPVLPPGSAWGGLRYPLVGSGTFAVESLRSYCRRAHLDDIRFVLEERLLKIIEQVMQYHRFSPVFYLQASYDHVLPVNLLIQPTSSPPGTPPYVIKPTALLDHPLKSGDYVRLEDFVITKVDFQHQTVTLNLPPSSAGPSASYCLRLQSVGAMASYRVNQIIDPIEGLVTRTRHEQLQLEAQRALGPAFSLESETLTLPDGTELPNPLLALPAILSEHRDVKVGCIHGDLNLENILVDPATRDVSLIDFAAAREDHLLHDFLRLETEIVTRLIPETLARANLAAGTIHVFYRQLHQASFQAGQSKPSDSPQPVLEKPFAMLLAIRKMASRYLFKPDDWEEYYQGLVLYLLGALKFKNLDVVLEAPLPKQVTFWGAATVTELLEGALLPPPDSDTMCELKPTCEKSSIGTETSTSEEGLEQKLQINIIKGDQFNAPYGIQVIGSDVIVSDQMDGVTSEKEVLPHDQLTKLHQRITAHFDKEELRTLCFDLGVEYDDLRGEGKAAKARELVAYLQRCGRIYELIAICSQRRPNVSWEDTAEVTKEIPPAFKGVPSEFEFTRTKSLLMRRGAVPEALEQLVALRDEILKGPRASILKVGELLDEFSRDKETYLQLLEEIRDAPGASETVRSTARKRIERARYGGR